MRLPAPLAASLIAAAWLSLGCHPISSDTTRAEPEPSATKPNPSPEPEPEPAREPEPEPEPALPACPSESSMPIYCTAAGELAGSWAPVDRVRVPERAEIAFDRAGANHDQSRMIVAIDGEQLYLRHVTCGACARVMGDGFSGRVSAMTDEQRRALQTELGLPDAAPLLISARAWADYAATPSGIEALTQIASRGRE